jgi:hypothetical protein
LKVPATCEATGVISVTGVVRSSASTNTPLQVPGTASRPRTSARTAERPADRAWTSRSRANSPVASGRSTTPTKSMSLRPDRNAPSAVEPTT